MDDAEEKALMSAFADIASKGWSTLEWPDFEAGWNAALDYARSQQEPIGWGVMSSSGKLWKASSTFEGAKNKEVKQAEKFGVDYRQMDIQPLYAFPVHVKNVRKSLTLEDIEACIDLAEQKSTQYPNIDCAILLVNEIRAAFDRKEA